MTLQYISAHDLERQLATLTMRHPAIIELNKSALKSARAFATELDNDPKLSDAYAFVTVRIS